MLHVIKKKLASVAPKLSVAMALLVVGLCCAHPCRAACTGASPTWTAASPSSSDVQSCLNEPLQCGDTVIVPSGSATWTSQVVVKPPTGCSTYQGVTVQGQTACNGTPGVQVTSCTDNTNITLSYSSTGFYVGPCSSTSFCTITGFTFITGADCFKRCARRTRHTWAGQFPIAPLPFQEFADWRRVDDVVRRIRPRGPLSRRRHKFV